MHRLDKSEIMASRRRDCFILVSLLLRHESANNVIQGEIVVVGCVM